MSFDLVLFGGTGDLAWRKLMPALFQAFRHGSLPEGGRIIGVARDDLSDDQYRDLIASRFKAVEGAKRPSEEEFAQEQVEDCKGIPGKKQYTLAEWISHNRKWTDESWAEWTSGVELDAPRSQTQD